MKIFISGSRSVIKLPADLYISKKDIVLVGDCYGVDLLIQQYCRDRNILFYVYYIGKYPRCFIKGGKKIQVRGDLYVHKDIQMSQDCDYGIAIWDGFSRGTKNNILRLKSLGKDCKIIEV